MDYLVVLITRQQGLISWLKIHIKKKEKNENFDFYENLGGGGKFFFKILIFTYFHSALTPTSKGARNIMTIWKMFSETWRSQKLKIWVKRRSRKCLKCGMNFGQKSKISCFFEIFFKQIAILAYKRLPNWKINSKNQKLVYFRTFLIPWSFP